jgi:carbon-monoxide dehydrogenase medium subunit
VQPFDYVVPRDHAEASALLAAGNGAFRPYQGGTDLLIRIRGGFLEPECVVDLKGLEGMREIRPGQDGQLVIGAACTMNQVAADPRVRVRYSLLAQACDSVASYQLRNRATIGGNCCNASPAADTAPALYCLGAQAEVYGSAGLRRIPIDSFFVGPGRNALAAGEFLTAVHLPPSPPGAAGVFNKLGRTKIGDISIVSVAVYAWPLGNGRREWRITLGAVGPTPLRAPQAEAILSADASSGGVEAAATAAAEAARPIDDIRASARYRRSMVAVMTRRGIEAVLAQMEGGQ